MGKINLCVRNLYSSYLEGGDDYKKVKEDSWDVSRIF